MFDSHILPRKPSSMKKTDHRHRLHFLEGKNGAVITHTLHLSSFKGSWVSISFDLSGFIRLVDYFIFPFYFFFLRG